jgi:L-threonylcarbamoyladenylate synthase
MSASNAAPTPAPASPTKVVPARLDAATLLADPAALAAAVAVLARGGLVAVPTETVYGLAADATNPAAVAAIYAAKGRPSKNPLIVHCADLAEADRHGILEADARRLAEAFWPGPLTLVVRRRPGSPVAAAVTAGLDTVALRVPDAPVVAALARALGRPLAAPSANRSGRVSATDADAVVAELAGAVDLVIDGGPSAIGVESTIVAVDAAGARLLRAGGLPADAIEAVLGIPLARPLADTERPTAPGQLASHYAPRAALRLEVADVRPGEALLAFGRRLPPGADAAVAVFQLSERGDVAEATRNLFAGLRALDATGAATIAVMPLPDAGLGEALADRLARAAAPRPGTHGESS